MTDARLSGDGSSNLAIRYLVILCIGMFLVVVDTTIVHVATPSIVEDLGTSLDGGLWVVNSYLLTFSGLLIVSARIGDMVGHKTVYLVGLLLFAAASTSCALAGSGPQLVTFRLLQGVGAALLSPQILVITRLAFAPQRLGYAYGVVAGVAGLAAVTGPTLGGVLVDQVGWQGIFWVKVPIAAVGAAAAWRYIPPFQARGKHHLDALGVVLLLAGMFGIAFVLIQGQHYEWGQVTSFVSIPLLAAAGGVVLSLFFLRERSAREPMVPFGVFQSGGFTPAFGLNAALSAALFGFVFMWQFYLQSVLDLTALQAGLLLLSINVPFALGSPIAGRIADRVDDRFVVGCGMAAYGLGLGGVAVLVSESRSALLFIAPLVVAGVGLAAFYSSVNTLALRSMEAHMVGSASGLMNASRLFGGLLGSAGFGAFIQARFSSRVTDLTNEIAESLPADMREELSQDVSSAAELGASGMSGDTGLARTALQIVESAYTQTMRMGVALVVGLLGVSLALWYLGAGLTKGRRALRPTTRAGGGAPGTGRTDA